MIQSISTGSGGGGSSNDDNRRDRKEEDEIERARRCGLREQARLYIQTN